MFSDYSCMFTLYVVLLVKCFFFNLGGEMEISLFSFSFVEFWRHYVVSGGTQRRALLWNTSVTHFKWWNTKTIIACMNHLNLTVVNLIPIRVKINYFSFPRTDNKKNTILLYLKPNVSKFSQIEGTEMSYHLCVFSLCFPCYVRDTGENL